MSRPMTHSQPLAPTQHYLSIRAVSIRLGVHPNTVRRWIAAGRLPATKIGKDYRVALADLNAARSAR